MVKTTNTKTTKPVTTASKAPVATDTKKKVAAKKETEVAPPPAPVETPVVVPEANVLAEQSMGFLAKLQQMSVMISSMKTEFRLLEKNYSREIKTLQKKKGKRASAPGTRAPSGFTKPKPITDALADFIGKPHGAEMARTDVTKEINQYIRAKKLQDKDNGRNINPDAGLSTLLKLSKDDNLTYFNLQKHLSHLFVPNPVPAVSSM